MRKITAILAVLFLSTISVVTHAQVKGKVTDSKDGAPIEGASVKVKGTNTGVSTGPDGTFELSAKSGTTLVVTSAGFEAKEVKASANMTVALVKDVRSLSEVVVTAFGVKRSDRSLGYSVSKVNPNELIQKSEPDLLKNLQGQVPGVDIRTSQGTPGAATLIQIRGNNSIGKGSQPLIVVDGVPYSNDIVATSSQTSGGTAYGGGLADLDANDIATVNILKGAAASQMYGSRGANGVVLITTKSGSGRKGKKAVNISLKSGLSMENISNLPTYQNDYGAGSQMGYSNSNGSWGPKFGTLDSINAWPEYLAAYPELFPTGKTAYKAYPNNVKDLFKTGMLYENSVGLNGGNDQSSVAMTLSNITHSSYVPNATYNKNNISLGGQTKLKYGINLGGNLSYSRSKQVGGYFGENQISGAASQFARSMFLARNWNIAGLPYQDANGKPLIPNGGSQYDNPVWASINNVATTIQERYVANVHIDANLTKWARIDYTFGYNTFTLGRKEITQKYSRAADGLGRIVTEDYKKGELESDLLLTLTPKINFFHDLDAKFVIGNSVNQRTSTDVGNTGLKFVVPGIYSLKNTATQSFDYDSYSRRRIVGIFANAEFSYKNYLFLGGSIRNDRTSTLPYANASYYYPEGHASFIFTDAFKLKSKWFDYGKLRFAIAKVGNDASPNMMDDVFGIGVNFLGQPTTYRSSSTTDPNLTPEFTREIEIGTELGFLNRRIGVDFTYYDRNSTDLITPLTIPTTTGYSSYYTNIGKISNKGIELGLTVIPVQTKNFSWQVRGSLTANKNKVIELSKGLTRTAVYGGISGTIASYVEPGMPYGYLRGTKSVRDSAGNLLIDPSTGGMIVSDEEGMVGDPNPDYKLGINNEITYKGFFLSALFDMTKGGDMYSVTVSSELGRGVTKDTKDRETAWVIPGVYGDAVTGKPIYVNGKEVVNQTRLTTNDLYFSPNATKGATFAINTATEWNVYDATVYRLRSLTLGYNLPASLLKKTPINSATLSFSAHNLWYLAPNFPKYSNFDPEVNSVTDTRAQGIELSGAPTTRRFGVNLNVTF